MQELQIINEILSAKPNNQTLSSFNKYLNNFYDITKKIAVENEIDLLLKLKAIESEMAIIAAYAELFSKHVIAVGGGFSAGKSAFVNSFLKSKDIQLPISIDPTTAIPSYVMSSDKDQIIGISKNNGVANLGKIAPDILSRLTHNADNRLDFSFNLKDILPFLVVSSEFNDPKYQNICFIDTPGYNPNSDGNRAQDFNTAKEFLANSSSLLWLISCDASGGNITGQDIEFLNSIGLENKKLYIVVNKADQRATSDLEEVLENLKETLEMEGIEYEGISLYSSVKQTEYKYDKISLFDFIYDQGQSKNSKAQVKIMENLISIYQSYERAVVTKQAYNEAIFSVAQSIAVEIAYIDDEDYEEQAFKISQYANNLKNEFKNSNYDDILQNLKRAFKELKSSIEGIFGSVYPWDMKSNEITTKDIDLPELRKITNLDDDDLPKKPKGNTKAIQDANTAIQKTGFFNFEVK
ncbi:dynamin family protein [Campylobacter lanienae]|uniref:dynamin family protein n=1 Tax=Campylobacter lanienae TaxID=75658 RepID=UPI002A91F705|nr:dynamin family protein [Campylobacter lanienae]MDY5520068.1 dynamin family protein [Campylobacter lanienae]